MLVNLHFDVGIISGRGIFGSPESFQHQIVRCCKATKMQSENKAPYRRKMKIHQRSSETRSQIHDVSTMVLPL